MEQSKLPTIFISLVPQIITLIVSECGVDDEKATEMFYSSKLFTVLEDEETKLWHLSAHALFEMFQEEQQTGNITYPEEA